jgi:hypothetical protein
MVWVHELLAYPYSVQEFAYPYSVQNMATVVLAGAIAGLSLRRRGAIVASPRRSYETHTVTARQAVR